MVGKRVGEVYEMALPGGELPMLTADETSVVAPAAASDTPKKLRQLFRKRLRQLGRVTLVLATCLVLASVAVSIWWLRSLNGLPDIVDPFDVAAIRAFHIPEDEDAFTFFRRANEKLSPCPLPPKKEVSAAGVAWSQADPKLRAWVAANQQALELFQQGAERFDGICRRPGEPYSGRHSEDLGPHYLTLLALVEGGRRVEGGDMAGAWDCYRAVLRATFHTARRGVLVERHWATVHHAWLRKRIETWAADTRTTIPQLRRALEESVEGQPRPEWHAFSLKVEYLDWMRDLEKTRHPDSYALQEEWTYRVGDMELPHHLTAIHYLARRFLLREPERSRRAIRLLFANWLAEVESPGQRQRKPAVQALFRHAKHSDSLRLYPVGPGAPVGARELSPHDLASWLVTASDLKLIVWNRLKPSVRLGERAGYRELVIALAGELYHRERGVLPPSEDALVGTYLESLPDDGSAELDDGTTPTVADSSKTGPS
jgi:hypothetical protein